jgi:hypothetical protein
MPTRGFGFDLLFGKERRTTPSAAPPAETPSVKTGGRGQAASPGDSRQSENTTTAPHDTPTRFLSYIAQTASKVPLTFLVAFRAARDELLAPTPGSLADTARNAGRLYFEPLRRVARVLAPLENVPSLSSPQRGQGGLADTVRNSVRVYFDPLRRLARLFDPK